MLKTNAIRRSGHQGAFTLIEVLVALIVFSIGLLGLASLQLTSLRNNHAAYLRSQATMLASDILDRMRANREAARDGDYDVALGGTQGSASDLCRVSECTPAQMAGFDIAEWGAALRTLPTGDGSVNVDSATNIVTILIQWDESRGAEAPIQFRLQTQL